MRKCVLVLGMHRSGTSLLAGVLRILGVDFGDNLLGPDSANERGYFEHKEILEINKLILKDLGSEWEDIKELPDLWYKKENMSKYKEKIKEIIQKDFRKISLFGIKEPRISLLLPLYLEVFKKLKITPVFAIVQREGVEIIESLKARNNFPEIKSLDLIKKYEASIEEFTKDEKRVYVSFGDLLNYPRYSIEKIKESLKIKLKKYGDFERDLVKFIEPKLKHHNLDQETYLRRILANLSEKNKEISQRDKEILEKNKEISQRDKEILEKNKEISQRDKEISEKVNIMSSKDKEMTEKSSQIEDLRKNIKNKDVKIRNLQADNAGLLEAKEGMERSTTWKLTRKIEKAVYSIFPEGSPGNKIYKEIISKIQKKSNKISSDKPTQNKKEEYPHKNRIWGQATKNKVPDLGENEKVSIITLTKNSKFLGRCIESVLKNTSYNNFEWIILFNSDENIKFLNNVKDKRIIPLKPKRELSFSEGNNFAVEKSSGKYVVFLNDDTEVLPNWLENMLSVYENKEKAGAVGNILIYPKKHLEYPAFSIQHSGIKFYIEKDLVKPTNTGKFESPFEVTSNIYRIPAVTAACLLIKKDIFNEVNGFDEKYRFGYEDVDLCLKLSKKGYSNFINPKSFVYHYESSSISDESRSDIRANRINNIKIFKEKWFDFLYTAVFNDLLNNIGFYNSSKLSIGFVISSNKKGAVYGDCLVARALGKYIERLGFSVYYINKNNPEIPTIKNSIIISMINDFDINLLNAKNIFLRIGWIRNRVEEWIRRPWFKSFDMFFASSEKMINILKKENSDTPISLLLIGADTEIFFPLDLKKKKDISFVGSYWGYNREMIKYLNFLKETKMEIYGIGWENFPEFKDFHKGTIDYSEIPLVYNSSWLVIDDQHPEVVKPYDSINSRVFEALACGTPVITNSNESIKEVFKDAVFCIKKPEEVNLLVKSLLAEKDTLKSLGLKAREEIIKNHSYQIRATQLKNSLKDYAQNIGKLTE